MKQEERLGDLVSCYKTHFGETAKIIFDCGTRDGEDADYLSQKLNSQKVYAIDASPRAVEETKSKYPYITVIQTALSNYNGTASFTEIISDRKDFVGSSSLVLSKGWDSVQTRQITTQVKTMKTLLTELKLTETELDIVKVDIEGFTYEFLEGMGDLIVNAKVMHLETETFHRHEGHRSSTEVKSYMEANGFALDSVSYEWGSTIEDQVWYRVQ